MLEQPNEPEIALEVADIVSLTSQKYIDELQAEVRLAVFRKRQQDRDEKEQLEHGPKPIPEDNLLRKEQPNT